MTLRFAFIAAFVHSLTLARINLEILLDVLDRSACAKIKNRNQIPLLAILF